MTLRHSQVRAFTFPHLASFALWSSRNRSPSPSPLPRAAQPYCFVPSASALRMASVPPCRLTLEAALPARALSPALLRAALSGLTHVDAPSSAAAVPLATSASPSVKAVTDALPFPLLPLPPPPSPATACAGGWPPSPLSALRLPARQGRDGLGGTINDERAKRARLTSDKGGNAGNWTDDLDMPAQASAGELLLLAVGTHIHLPRGWSAARVQCIIANTE